VRVGRKHPEQIVDFVRDGPVRNNLGYEGLQLGTVGQRAEEQQIGDLIEGAGPDELMDVVSPVDQLIAIRIDLGDLLAMRSVQPVPDGPWMFTPGQDITLQWSPKEDLANYVPSICFTPDAPSSTGSTCATFTIAGDRITFALPGVKSPGRLDISLQGDGDWLPCSGARCQLSNTPQFTHPIAWRLPGQGSSSASSAP